MHGQDVCWRRSQFTREELDSWRYTVSELWACKMQTANDLFMKDFVLPGSVGGKKEITM
jgi:hypothetical protein